MKPPIDDFEHIEVLEPGQSASPGAVACELGRHIRFTTERLQDYCFVRWEPVIFDALLVAAAVEFADRIVGRPEQTWQRHFSIRIPVHEPERWNASDAGIALVKAVQFLTGDHWQFEFVPRVRSEAPPPTNRLDFQQTNRVVVPFSEGMDSFAVAGLLEAQLGANLIRVRMGSKVNDRPAAQGQPGLFTSIPYEVRAAGHRFYESSGRSRGFKFAILSGLTAYLLKADEIVLPESGQGALGPVLLPVGQGYEDYRNHPLFTERMERFLNALFGHSVRFTFPRLWNTKGETLREYVASANGQAEWQATRSCWQKRYVSVDGRRRQCGVCAACMLRRMSVHAAGLSEPRETYVWERLDVAEFKEGAPASFDKNIGAMREYAIAGILHMDHMAELGTAAPGAASVKRHAGELARARKLDVDDVEAKLSRLFARHASEWKAFVDALGDRSFVRGWVAQ